LIALYALLVVAAAFSLAPIQDETYYWTWGQSPGWSFVDHPPGISFVLAASSALLGKGLLGLRIPALLSMLVVVLCEVAAVRRLAGQQTSDRASMALLLLAGAPMFAVGYLPATPDCVQGALAAFSAYLVIRALEKDARPIWRALAAFVLVASILVKHSSALLALGAFAALLVHPEGRRALARPAPWIGATLGALVLVPWLLADSAGSMAYQEARVLHRGLGRGLLALPVFFGGVLVALGPTGGLLLFTEGAREIRNRRSPAETALATGALLLLAVCFVPVLKGGGELNWSMPSLVFALPVISARFFEANGRAARALRVVAGLSAAAMAVILLHVAHPLLPIPAKKDTTRRGAGFEAIARSVKALADESGARAIVTKRYQLASMIRYHTKDAIPVIELGSDRKSQYDVWKRPKLDPGDVAIVVLYGPDLPEDLDVDPLEPPIELVRESGGEALNRYFMTVVKKRYPGGRT
jgi:4-amino-4-deoxy-L-arabinose transferase-like glycosyltransferase